MTILVSEHAKNTGSSVATLCRTVGLPRATYYRHRKKQEAPSSPAPATGLRDAVHQIALECSAYGYRRVTAQLRQQGVVANR